MFKFIFNCENLNEIRCLDSDVYSNDVSIYTKLDNKVTLTKTVIEYSDPDKVVVLKSSIGNPLPLFWGWRDLDLIVSDSASMVLEVIKGNSGVNIEDLDQVAVLESILFDGALGERTLFSRVKKVQNAEEVVFNLLDATNRKSWRWLPSIQTSTLSDEQIYNATKFHLSNLMVGLERFDGDVLLPLTGGLDSRLIAALLKSKTNGDVHTYTFQRGWSFETWCAKKVAKYFNFSHHIFNLDERCYKEFAHEVVVKSGGMVTGMHTHGIYCCEKLLPFELKKLPRLFGYFGEHVTGAMTDSIEEGMALSTPEAIFDKYKLSLFPELVDQFKSAIIADLNITFDAFNLSDSPKHTFHEFWRIQQRQNNLITHLFHYHRACSDVRIHEPFINEEFIKFFLSLPHKYRVNRTIFKEVAADIFPGVFGLPSMHYKSNSLFAIIERIFEFAESAVNKIVPSQEFFLSPFKYEQHQKNLQNYLSSDVEKGVEILSLMYKVKPIPIKYPLWRYGSTEKEHYRLASLSYLLTDVNV